MAAESGSSKKVLVYVLAVLVLILSAVLLYVQYNSLANLRAEEEQEQFALDNAYRQLATLNNHRNNAAEYEQRLEFALKKIPTAPGEEELLRYIQQVAVESGVRAPEIRFAGRSEGESFTTMALTFSIEGSFQDLRQFLTYIQSGDRAIRVSTIRISRGGSETGNRVALTASAFYNPGN